jgi:predicted LPLAT superfamily acyltransferase
MKPHTPTPHGQRPEASPWLKQPERSNAVALAIIVWIARRLGRRAGRAMLYPICGYFVAFSVKARDASRAYLGRVLDRKPGWADVFRHYHAFACVLLDRVFLLTGDRSRFDVQVHGEDAVRELAKAGRGALLAGGHYGSFEILRTIGIDNDVRVRLAMYEANARKLRALFSVLDSRLAADIIALGGPASMLEVKEAIDRGHFVGVLADRSRPGGKTERCNFLAGDAPFALGPWQLARALGIPVVLMFGVYRGGSRYEVHFEPLGEVTDPAAAAKAFARRLEHYCRAAPYNWFNFYDFWASRA